MAERRPTMMDPPVESLLSRVDSKFTLVTLAARRGRQINSYFNQLGQGLGAIVPPQVRTTSTKPVSIAPTKRHPGAVRGGNHALCLAHVAQDRRDPYCRVIGHRW